MRDAFVRALVREMESDPRVMILTGDLGFGVLRPFWERFPDRIVNAGIAEQGMIGLAAGLSMTGRKVIVYSISNFPTLRPLEQIRNDCAYNGAEVKIVCVGGGFVYGPLGMSHHATEDISVMRALPGVTCFAPGDPAETEAVVPEMLRTRGTCYLRIGRSNEPKAHSSDVTGWRLPDALVLRVGKDIALLSTGGVLSETAKAAEILEKRGVSAEIVSFPCFKPLDGTKVLELADRFARIITVEENNLPGGFGSAVCEVISGAGKACAVTRLGLPDTYAHEVGDQAYLRDIYGLSAEKIAGTAAALL